MNTHVPGGSRSNTTDLQGCVDGVNPNASILNKTAPARGAASLADENLRVHNGFKTFVNHLSHETTRVMSVNSLLVG
jgi:hypothetical protein